MTKSANMRVALLPYPVIAAAVGGNPDAIARVIRHYSSYITMMQMAFPASRWMKIYASGWK